MQARTAQLLRSPIRHEDLELISPQGGTPYLRERASGTCFPIVNGIAHLLDQQRVVDYNRQYQRFYNLIAPLYDSALTLGAKLTRHTVGQVRRQYLTKLELAPAARFLEVSIGTAANIQYLRDDIDCFGIDISLGMLKKAQTNLRRWQRKAELILADAEELPFKDQIFDSVLHVGGINAFNDREAAIREMVRVAKAGTRIVIVDETAKLITRLSWFPGGKTMLRKYADRFEPPLTLLPAGVTEVEVSELLDGGLYCLSFRSNAAS